MSDDSKDTSMINNEINNFSNPKDLLQLVRVQKHGLNFLTTYFHRKFSNFITKREHTESYYQFTKIITKREHTESYYQFTKILKQE